MSSEHYDDSGNGDHGSSFDGFSDLALGDPSTPDPAVAPAEPDEIALPDPHQDDIWWQGQSEDGLCMPTSVAMVISEFSGKPYSLHLEGEVATTAVDHGWLLGEPGAWKGMTADGGMQLLEHFGIDAHLENGSLEKLEEYKTEGRDIILTIDSDYVWYGGEQDGNPNIDHAVVFGGVDTSSDPPMVILEDPGTADGKAERVPLDMFEKAWAAGNNQMVVTDGRPAWQSDIGEPLGARPPEPEQPSDTTRQPSAPEPASPDLSVDPTAPSDPAATPAPAPETGDAPAPTLPSATAALGSIPGQPFPGDHPSDSRQTAGGAGAWVGGGVGAVLLPIVLAGRELRRRRELRS
jgi:hypothetical protein